MIDRASAQIVSGLRLPIVQTVRTSYIVCPVSSYIGAKEPRAFASGSEMIDERERPPEKPRLPPPAVIIVSLMIVAVAGTQVAISRSIGWDIPRPDDDRPDSNCPPRPGIPPPTIVVAISGAAIPITGTVLLVHVYPTDGLDKRRGHLRRRSRYHWLSRCCRRHTNLHSRRTCKSSDQQDRQRMF
jgi:hypothetical protein